MRNLYVRYYTIVGLPYNDVGHELETYYDEVSRGRHTLTLFPDYDCPYDACAVTAYDDQRGKVGHVCHRDREDVWLRLKSTPDEMMTVEVNKVDRQHNVLVVKIDGDNVTSTATHPLPEKLEQWRYTGPKLKKNHQFKVIDIMQMRIVELLDRYDRLSATENALLDNQLKRYIDEAVVDLSGELLTATARLHDRLLAADASRFAEVARQLMMLPTLRRCGMVPGGKVYALWAEILSMKHAQLLLPELHSYDPVEVERQLYRFPEGLYEVWRTCPSQFLIRLSYLNLPRKVLGHLVSGLLFVALCSRVDAGQPLGKETLLAPPDALTEKGALASMASLSTTDIAVPATSAPCAREATTAAVSVASSPPVRPVTAEAAEVNRLIAVALQSPSLFWAASAWTVVYCYARDHLSPLLSMAEFERMASRSCQSVRFPYPCKEGVVRNTLRHNGYMTDKISNWKEDKKNKRVFILLRELRKQMPSR